MFIDSLSLLTVQAVPAPCSTKALASRRIRLGISSQKEILFRRGNAINYINLKNKLFLRTEFYFVFLK